MLQSFHIWLWYGHMTGTNTPPLCEDYRCVMDRSHGDLHAVRFSSLLSFLHWNSKIMLQYCFYDQYYFFFEVHVHVLSLLFLHYLLVHLWGFFFLLWSLCWLEGDSCIALKLVLIIIYDAYSTYYWKNQTENLSNLFHCMEAVVVEKP